MLLGVRGKAAGWQALRQVPERDDRLSADRLDELIARAERQPEVLEALRRDVAAEVRVAGESVQDLSPRAGDLESTSGKTGPTRPSSVDPR